MPELARFFGIIIAMFYDDHPPPHFHVRYGAQRATVAIETLTVIEGALSRAGTRAGDGMGGTAPGRASRGMGARPTACTLKGNSAVGVRP